MSAVREELGAICSQYSWLGGVWQFLQQWEGRGRATQLSAEEFEVCQLLAASFIILQAIKPEGGSGLSMTSPSSTLQSTLTQLHQWIGQISLLPSHLSTSHSLVSVGSGEVVATVLPRLTAILEQLKEMGVEHTRRVCKRVLQETKDRSEVRTHACAYNIHVHIDVFRVD